MRSLFNLLAICVVATLCATDEPKCREAHEVYNNDIGMCYLYESTFKDYASASDYCTSIGYKLVAIHSESENSAVANFAAINFGFENEDFWIGMSNTVSKTFTWIDSTFVNYANWGVGEPVIDRHCGTMQIADYLWYSADCSLKKPFVCVGPPQSNSSTDTSPCVPEPAQVDCNCTAEVNKYKNLLKLYGHPIE